MKYSVIIFLLALVLGSCSNDPVACFSVDQFDATDKNHNFTFTNCSENSDSYHWVFEYPDQSIQTSDEATPSKNFGKFGKYKVTLTASGKKSSNSITKYVTIHEWIWLRDLVVLKMGQHDQFNLKYQQVGGINCKVSNNPIPKLTSFPKTYLRSNFYDLCMEEKTGTVGITLSVLNGSDWRDIELTGSTLNLAGDNSLTLTKTDSGGTWEIKLNYTLL